MALSVPGCTKKRSCEDTTPRGPSARALTRNNESYHLILDSLASRTVSNKCLLFKPKRKKIITMQGGKCDGKSLQKVLRDYIKRTPEQVSRTIELHCF